MWTVELQPAHRRMYRRETDEALEPKPPLTLEWGLGSGLQSLLNPTFVGSEGSVPGLTASVTKNNYFGAAACSRHAGLPEASETRWRE